VPNKSAVEDRLQRNHLKGVKILFQEDNRQVNPVNKTNKLGIIEIKEALGIANK